MHHKIHKPIQARKVQSKKPDVMHLFVDPSEKCAVLSLGENLSRDGLKFLNQTKRRAPIDTGFCANALLES